MAFVTLKHAITQAYPRSPGSTASDDTVIDQMDPERQPLLDASTASKSQSRSNNTAASSSREGFQIDARIISDATIGLSDGLTVPFALTAGLSALGQTKVVIYGGLAELIAGAISMGLGGYLGAKSEAASYRETRKECCRLVQDDPSAAADDIKSVFGRYDLPEHLADELSRHLSAKPDQQVDFLVRFNECVEEPASNRAAISALTIATGYLLGGFIPLLPYFFVAESQVDLALWISVAVMVVALFAFGYVKTCAVSGWRGARCVGNGVLGGLEMVVVGGAAAGAAMGLVKLFDGMAGN